MSYNIKILSKYKAYPVISQDMIKKIATHRLLSIYKSLHSYNGVDDEDYEEWGKNVALYQAALKAELNTREHVDKKKKISKNTPRRNLILNRLIKNKELFLKDEAEIRDMYKKCQLPLHYGLSEIIKAAKIIRLSKEKN